MKTRWIPLLAEKQANAKSEVLDTLDEGVRRKVRTQTKFVGYSFRANPALGNEYSC